MTTRSHSYVHKNHGITAQITEINLCQLEIRALPGVASSGRATARDFGVVPAGHPTPLGATPAKSGTATHLWPRGQLQLLSTHHQVQHRPGHL
jgi:hypothetical protein